MTAPVQIVIALVALIVSARARLDAVILGRPLSVPWLGIIAAVIVLTLAVAVLYLARAFVREGLRLRPGTVTA